jgi:hypothetical protein
MDCSIDFFFILDKSSLAYRKFRCELADVPLALNIANDFG